MSNNGTKKTRISFNLKEKSETEREKSIVWMK